MIIASALLLLAHQHALAQSGPDSTSVAVVLSDDNAVYYAPAISADGRILFFASDRGDGVGGHDCWYVARAAGDSMFSAPYNPGTPLNSAKNEGAMAITADGRTLYFTACHRPGGRGDCDIFQATLDGDTWRDVHPVSELNTPFWDSQPTVSADGRTIYFASNRLSQYEDAADLYMSTVGPSGKWSPPRNVGAPINTPQDEQAPFLALDGETLFFSSKGHGGLGGFDFFYASRLPDGSWASPVNMGAAFNTELDERFLSIPASGDVVYYCSEREGESVGRRLQLFAATVPPLCATTLLRCIVHLGDTLPISAPMIAVVDSASEAVIAIGRANRITGEFFAVVPASAYATLFVYGSAIGRGTSVQHVQLPMVGTYSEVNLDIPLVDCGQGRTSPAAERSRLCTTPSVADSVLSVDCSALDPAVADRTVHVFSWTGVEVQTLAAAPGVTHVPVAELPTGAYLVRVGNEAALVQVAHQGR